ncbi:stressosome-associated protein Prli42 [Sporosarcina jiandibaonis]|nr:stressosome-associated protein Prli42 [Sporosarcina jiandibaonis]
MANKNVRKWILYIMIAAMLLSGLGMGFSMM